MDMEAILTEAQRIADMESPDAGARYLAPHRKEACLKLHDDMTHLGALLRIVCLQMHFLTQAGYADKARDIAGWFLHLLHHLESEVPKDAFIALKRMYRESFSLFYYRYAEALRDLDEVEGMRLSLRTALDLTQQREAVIVAALHLLQPFVAFESLEGESAANWLSKRLAEFLAQLDFAGKSDSAFRSALDAFQYCFRQRNQDDVFPKAKSDFESLVQDCADDPEMQGLRAVAKLWFCHE